MLKIKNAVCGYKQGKKQKVILQDFSCNIKAGEVLCVLGVNGIGKTTLFKSILGGIPLLGGQIILDDKNLSEMNRTEIARNIGYVPQSHQPPFPFTVEQIVVMGRTAHLGLFATPQEKDIAIAKTAMSEIGIGHLAQEIYTEISGGERQLTLIARALAQKAKYLIMDEPAANLDYGNQIRLLKYIKKLAQKGHGIVITTHYPNHAFLVADKVAVLMGDNKYRLGSPQEILTNDLLQKIYGINAEIIIRENAQGEKTKAVIAFLE